MRTTGRGSLFLAREKGGSDGEHLAGDGGGEGVDLSCVLLNLPAVEQGLESAGLLGKLEKPLPLVLGQRGLLADGALGILGLALLLPSGDLGLLTLHGALVVLVVVELGVVVLYAVEQEVARLLEEGVDGKVERLEVGSKGHGSELRVAVEGCEAARELQLGVLGWGRGELVEERGDDVRVVDGDGQFGEDVLVAEAALLEAATRRESVGEEADGTRGDKRQLGETKGNRQ